MQYLTFGIMLLHASYRKFKSTLYNTESVLLGFHYPIYISCIYNLNTLHEVSMFSKNIPHFKTLRHNVYEKCKKKNISKKNI